MQQSDRFNVFLLLMTTDGSEEGVKERATLPEEGCLLREVEMVMVYFQQQSVSQSVLLAQGHHPREGSLISG